MREYETRKIISKPLGPASMGFPISANSFVFRMNPRLFSLFARVAISELYKGHCVSKKNATASTLLQ